MNAFEFSPAPIDTAALAAPLARPDAGGFAAFEGRVRDLNEGRRVDALDYEAFEALAIAEGERIVEAALSRHGALAGRCVHRVGRLAVGDVAVWVGVAAPHRAEAFAACREIIDAIKHRLPIWKKEHYADGDSGWVNCEHAAGHGATGFDYSRQLALPEVGDAGQARLAAARVLVVGAGGLGCAVLTSLAGAGVGELTIVDADRVDASNLHRQPLYVTADVGRPKAEAAAARLAAYNPDVSLKPLARRFDAALAAELVAAADVVVDCTDNFAAKFLVERRRDARGRAGGARQRLSVRGPASGRARRSRRLVPALPVAGGDAGRAGRQLRRGGRARPGARGARPDAGDGSAEAPARPAGPDGRRAAAGRPARARPAPPVGAAQPGLRRRLRPHRNGGAGDRRRRRHAAACGRRRGRLSHRGHPRAAGT